MARTAEVKRDARIGEAEAKKDAQVFIAQFSCLVKERLDMQNHLSFKSHPPAPDQRGDSRGGEDGLSPHERHRDRQGQAGLRAEEGGLRRGGPNQGEDKDIKTA